MDKHVKEIQSQLGNYFLRITSPKLVTRAKEAFSSSLLTSRSAPHPLNAELNQMVQSLPARIEERMDALEAGEALNEIMSVLRVVSLPAFSSSRRSHSSNRPINPYHPSRLGRPLVLFH